MDRIVARQFHGLYATILAGSPLFSKGELKGMTLKKGLNARVVRNCSVNQTLYVRVNICEWLHIRFVTDPYSFKCFAHVCMMDSCHQRLSAQNVWLLLVTAGLHAGIRVKVLTHAHAIAFQSHSQHSYAYQQEPMSRRVMPFLFK